MGDPHRRQHDRTHQCGRPNERSYLPHFEQGVLQHKTGNRGNQGGEQQTFGFQHRQQMSPLAG
ncbi:hypothetical protein D3C71_2031080 [compost metagenome]